MIRHDEPLLTVEEVAHLLGVPRQTIYNWVYAKRIPHVKPSRSLLRFRREEIEAWLAARSVPERGSKNADDV